jgi:dTDP-4-amino-4,6-dideoxygalactose transaminase
MTDSDRLPILLSPPHLSGREQEYVMQVLADNWVAPAGPWLDRFEAAICRATGAAHAVALSSGTAALHLALVVAGVKPGDTVISASMTFVGAVNPIVYVGATPVFVDSEPLTGNLDTNQLASALSQLTREGRPARAVIATHLYGRCADLATISALCRQHGTVLIEDAAEALGATYQGRAAGIWGDVGIYSFNGNKVITTGGGGALVTANGAWAERARKLATQAREPALHYEHRELGYNYRLSSVSAAVGLAQLEALPERVAARRQINAWYRDRLSEVTGISFPPLSEGDSCWLTTLVLSGELGSSAAASIRSALAEQAIEARPLWKPMHLQPLYQHERRFGGEVSAALFERGICLPSGSALTEAQVSRVCSVIRTALGA